MSYRITTQRVLRREFRDQNPHLDFRRIKNYSGNGTMFKTDTRCAWCDWLDAMSRNGDISQKLAERATLD